MEEIRLPLLNCFVTEFPSNGTLCSSLTPVCYTCPLVSSYLSEDSGQGQQTCYLLWSFILVMGSFGIVTNCMSITVLLWKSPCGPSLTSLLIPLSIFDMIACGFAVRYSTLSLVILENLSRSWSTMMLYHISLVTYLLGRTGSLFISILITVERYLVVAHPFTMKIWLSVRKTRVIACITCILAILSNLPRYFSVTLTENHSAKDIAQLQHFPYLFQSSWLGIIFFKKIRWLGRIHFVLDFLLPMPVLLAFNIMLFQKIAQANVHRRFLNPSQRNEVKSAKMFSMVIIILLLCHILPISYYIYLTFFKLIYRELSFGTTLSVSVNASVNFLIYMAYAKAFRQRFLELITDTLNTVKSVMISCKNDREPRNTSKTNSFSNALNCDNLSV